MINSVQNIIIEYYNVMNYEYLQIGIKMINFMQVVY